jgi:hypothetical protein
MVLDILGKVFYFLLAIAERFTSDDPVTYIKKARGFEILGL